MNIVVSVNYKELKEFNLRYKDWIDHISHVQLSGLPGDIDTIREGLKKDIVDFKRANNELFT